jgi:glucosyl-dolichyl phosphate glucuronosyltransferase
MKFKEAGLRAWYDPAATVYHRIPRARMSLDYLCKWGYSQGISDSFNEIRARQYDQTYLADHRINPPELTRKTIRYYMGRIRELALHQLVSNIATRIMRQIPLSQPNIKARLWEAYWQGYKYHQNEVRKDPELLKWVLQEDYWDCQHRMNKNITIASTDVL